MTGPRRTDRRRMRALNTQLVLDCIRSLGRTSQADLIRATHLNTGTIVSIIRDLRARGLVVVAGRGASRGGRRPTLLRLNPSAAYVLSCQVGSASAVVAVLDLCAEVLLRRSLPIPSATGPRAFMDLLSSCILELRRWCCFSGHAVAGLGLSLHGPVDSERGILLVSEHLGWREVPFGETLGEAVGVPVFARAETRAIAVAEQRWGAARDVRDFVVVELDTGIGMVQVLDGKLCRGRHDMAGELGFTVWETRGGRTDSGCPRVLEDVASLRALCRRAQELPDVVSVDVSAWGRESPEELWLRRLVLASRQGSEPARRVLACATNALGLAIANVVNLFDPELVLLTGRLVSGADGALVGPLRRCSERHVLATQEHAPGISCAQLGEDAALLGAASQVIDHFLSVDNFPACPSAPGGGG